MTAQIRVVMTTLALLTLVPSIGRPQAGPLFPRLYPNPTGQNGMEEIFRAADMISGLQELTDAMQSEATLTEKRKAMQHPRVKQALLLIRAGLVKPLLPPQFEPADFRPLAAVRNVARLLTIEQYVLWADGKTNQALDSVRNLLQIGYVVQKCALIGNLTGVAIDSMAIGVLRDRLLQLSQPDCRKLRALAEAWLRLPDPATDALKAEKAISETLLLPSDLPQRDAVAAILAARWEAVLRVLQTPAWERRLPKFQSGETPAEKLAQDLWQTLEPSLNRILDVWARELAQIQLLGVHAAILDYRWEYNSVPETLDELKLGALGVDPFTGRPFHYKKTGRLTYELSSEGPVERDESGQPIGPRRPLTLGPSN